jgi:hypothetical protein
MEIPELDPGQIGEATVEVPTPFSGFEWITTYRQLPSAIRLRTRTGSQKFDVEVERSVDPEWVDGTAKAGFLKVETEEDWAPFQVRCFDRTRTGLRANGESRNYDFTPGELEFTDTTQIFGATQAALASLDNPGVWWMTSNLIQTSPTVEPPPLRFLLPWNRYGVIAKISPKFRLKNPSFLGFPTPFMSLNSERGDFEINFTNANFEGLFPPKTLEVDPPGLEWSLSSKAGSWPSFAGFLMNPLPEVQSPVIRLGNRGPWSVSVDFEWIERPELIDHLEVRSRTGIQEWGTWLPLDRTPIEGDQVMFRCWFDPLGAKPEYSLRSLDIRFSKN